MSLSFRYYGCNKGYEVTLLPRITACFAVAGRLLASVFCFMLLFPSRPAMASGGSAGDEFLTGYVTSVLEMDLKWEKDSYILNIVDGVTTTTPCLYSAHPFP